MAQIELDSSSPTSSKPCFITARFPDLRDGEHYFYENVLESHAEPPLEVALLPLLPNQYRSLHHLLGLGSFWSTEAMRWRSISTAKMLPNYPVADSLLRLAARTEGLWNGDAESPWAFISRSTVLAFVRSQLVPQCDGLRSIARASGSMWSRGCKRQSSANGGDGDEVRLTFDMPVDRLYAHPAATEDNGRFALRRTGALLRGGSRSWHGATAAEAADVRRN